MATTDAVATASQSVVAPPNSDFTDTISQASVGSPSSAGVAETVSTAQVETSQIVADRRVGPGITPISPNPLIQSAGNEMVQGINSALGNYGTLYERTLNVFRASKGGFNLNKDMFQLEINLNAAFREISSSVDTMKRVRSQIQSGEFALMDPQAQRSLMEAYQNSVGTYVASYGRVNQATNTYATNQAINESENWMRASGPLIFIEGLGGTAAYMLANLALPGAAPVWKWAAGTASTILYQQLADVSRTGAGNVIDPSGSLTRDTNDARGSSTSASNIIVNSLSGPLAAKLQLLEGGSTVFQAFLRGKVTSTTGDTLLETAVNYGLTGERPTVQGFIQDWAGEFIFDSLANRWMQRLPTGKIEVVSPTVIEKLNTLSAGRNKSTFRVSFDIGTNSRTATSTSSNSTGTNNNSSSQDTSSVSPIEWQILESRSRATYWESRRLNSEAEIRAIDARMQRAQDDALFAKTDKMLARSYETLREAEKNLQESRARNNRADPRGSVRFAQAQAVAAAYTPLVRALLGKNTDVYVNGDRFEIDGVEKELLRIDYQDENGQYQIKKVIVNVNGAFAADILLNEFGVTIPQSIRDAYNARSANPSNTNAQPSGPREAAQILRSVGINTQIAGFDSYGRIIARTDDGKDIIVTLGSNGSISVNSYNNTSPTRVDQSDFVNTSVTVGGLTTEQILLGRLAAEGVRAVSARSINVGGREIIVANRPDGVEFSVAVDRDGKLDVTALSIASGTNFVSQDPTGQPSPNPQPGLTPIQQRGLADYFDPDRNRMSNTYNPNDPLAGMPPVDPNGPLGQGGALVLQALEGLRSDLLNGQDISVAVSAGRQRLAGASASAILAYENAASGVLDTLVQDVLAGKTQLAPSTGTGTIFMDPLNRNDLRATVERYRETFTRAPLQNNYPDVSASTTVVSSGKTPETVGKAIKTPEQLAAGKRSVATRFVNFLVGTGPGKALISRAFGIQGDFEIQMNEAGLRVQTTVPNGQKRFFVTFEDLSAFVRNPTIRGFSDMFDLARRPGRGGVGNPLDEAALDQFIQGGMNEGIERIGDAMADAAGSSLPVPGVGLVRTNFFEFSSSRNKPGEAGSGLVLDPGSPTGMRLNIARRADGNFVLLGDLEVKVTQQFEGGVGAATGRTINYPGGRSGYGLIPAGTVLSPAEVAKMEWGVRNPALFSDANSGPKTAGNMRELMRFWEVSPLTRGSAPTIFDKVQFAPAPDGTQGLRLDVGAGTGLKVGLPFPFPSFGVVSAEGGLVMKFNIREGQIYRLNDDWSRMTPEQFEIWNNWGETPQLPRTGPNNNTLPRSDSGSTTLAFLEPGGQYDFIQGRYAPGISPGLVASTTGTGPIDPDITAPGGRFTPNEIRRRLDSIVGYIATYPGARFTREQMEARFPEIFDIPSAFLPGSAEAVFQQKLLETGDPEVAYAAYKTVNAPVLMGAYLNGYLTTISNGADGKFSSREVDSIAATFLQLKELGKPDAEAAKLATDAVLNARRAGQAPDAATLLTSLGIEITPPTAEQLDPKNLNPQEKADFVEAFRRARAEGKDPAAATVAGYERIAANKVQAQLDAKLDQIAKQLKGSLSNINPELGALMDVTFKGGLFAESIVRLLQGKDNSKDRALTTGLNMLATGAFGADAAKWAGTALGIHSFATTIGKFNPANVNGTLIGDATNTITAAASIFTSGLLGPDVARVAGEISAVANGVNQGASFLANPSWAGGFNFASFLVGQLWKSPAGAVVGAGLGVAGALATAGVPIVGLLLAGFGLINALVGLNGRRIEIDNTQDANGDGVADRISYQTSKRDYYYEITNGSKTLPIETMQYSLEAVSVPAGSGTIAAGVKVGDSVTVNYPAGPVSVGLMSPAGARAVQGTIVAGDGNINRGGGQIGQLYFRPNSYARGNAPLQAMVQAGDGSYRVMTRPELGGWSPPISGSEVIGYKLSTNTKFVQINDARSLVVQGGGTSERGVFGGLMNTAMGVFGSTTFISADQYNSLMQTLGGQATGKLDGADIRSETLRTFVAPGNVTYFQKMVGDGMTTYRDVNGDGIRDRITNYANTAGEGGGDGSTRIQLIDRGGRAWMEYAINKDGIADAGSIAGRMIQGGGSTFTFGGQQLFGVFREEIFLQSLMGQDTAVSWDPQLRGTTTFSPGFQARLGRDWSDLKALTYIASRPELLTAYASTSDAGLAEAGRSHYEQWGKNAGWVPTFDPAAYMEANPDVKTWAGGDLAKATMHYIRWGYASGFAIAPGVASPPAPLDYQMQQLPWKALAYVASYPDLMNAFGKNLTNLQANAIRHFQAVGAAEGRQVSFNPWLYMEANPDVKAWAGGNAEKAAQHFIQSGRYEARILTPGGDVRNADIRLTPAQEAQAAGFTLLGSSITSGAIRTNQYLQSENGQFFAVMQSDGNLVVYGGTPTDNRGVVWNSQTGGQAAGGVAIMQADGNLGIYDASSQSKWYSNTGNTAANRNMVLVMQDDGNLVIYDSQGGEALWSSKGGKIKIAEANGVTETSPSTVQSNSNVIRNGFVGSLNYNQDDGYTISSLNGDVIAARVWEDTRGQLTVYVTEQDGTQKRFAAFRQADGTVRLDSVSNDNAFSPTALAARLAAGLRFGS